jgi:hypothetical protein
MGEVQIKFRAGSSDLRKDDAGPDQALTRGGSMVGQPRACRYDGYRTKKELQDR